jgi:hypothetical protein
MGRRGKIHGGVSGKRSRNNSGLTFFPFPLLRHSLEEGREKRSNWSIRLGSGEEGRIAEDAKIE